MEARISRHLLDRLLAEAAASPDVEVCGLLLGVGDRIVAAPGAANVASDPRDRFEIDPVALFAAHRAERDGGPRLLGHYHSHPHGPPTPSPRDDAAAEPGRLWLILGDGTALGWLSCAGGGFDPVPLVVA